MDLNLDFFNKKRENEESNAPIVNDDCEEFSLSCTSFSEPVDTSKMSEDIYDLFAFNSEVLYLTESLWKELLKISDLEDVLSERDLCYSIIDADNCNTLNKYFLSLNYNLISLQRTYIESNSRKNYTDLLDDTLSALKNFIKQTFPYLKKNVEHLIFKIQRSNGEKIKTSSHKAENFGREANIAIHKYLKQLRTAITHFKISNVPDEIFDKKMKIEMEIEESYIDKSFFLGIPINDEEIQSYDIINYNEESYDFDTTTDFYNNFISTEAGDITDYVDATTSNNIASEDIETTENFKMTREPNFPVQDNALVETVKLNKQELANISSSKNLEAEGFRNSDTMIVSGSLLLL
ncbi:hypothetical protein NBO_480g0001 [Nosema bombycis CQ1]|uniref:Uncharacterized protein n=1 Tax=Nosema bombycis (strain CQ1 / CVCC 102059) TaxID=578461 RepID=R0M2L2_NOSB1|nr:hypothetical protein NBO_480g0001 [Nosema bombycis CQ1]|eukprot:EOB12274.1 hypothetical protein NBO_480g0001 [Nosema bombycis CQ1]